MRTSPVALRSPETEFSLKGPNEDAWQTLRLPLILAATNDPTLLASRDVDLAAIFRGSEGVVELEVLKAENDDSTSVTFDYEPDYCRFTER